MAQAPWNPKKEIPMGFERNTRRETTIFWLRLLKKGRPTHPPREHRGVATPGKCLGDFVSPLADGGIDGFLGIALLSDP